MKNLLGLFHWIYFLMKIFLYIGFRVWGNVGVDFFISLLSRLFYKHRLLWWCCGIVIWILLLFYYYYYLCYYRLWEINMQEYWVTRSFINIIWTTHERKSPDQKSIQECWAVDISPFGGTFRVHPALSNFWCVTTIGNTMGKFFCGLQTASLEVVCDFWHSVDSSSPKFGTMIKYIRTERSWLFREALNQVGRVIYPRNMEVEIKMFTFFTFTLIDNLETEKNESNCRAYSA